MIKKSNKNYQLVLNTHKLGISLVTLIITIIILIIMTASIIATFIDGGLIDKAKESVFKNDIRTYQDKLAYKNAKNKINLEINNEEDSEINADTLEKIQEIIPEFKEEYKDLIIIKNGKLALGTREEEPYNQWLMELDIGIPQTSVVMLLEVGDYVNYNISSKKQKEYNIKEKIGNNATNWIYNDTNKNNTYDAGEEKIVYKDIMWRVLNNNGSTVTLISAEPIENIYLYGKNGYLKGPSKLDEICSQIYGGRNINIEDINEILKGNRKWGDNETNWIYYGTDKNYHNVLSGIKTIAELEASGQIGASTINNKNTPEDQKDIGKYSPNYYYYSKSSLTNINDTIKSLIFKNNSYWISSCCVRADFNESFARFCIRLLDNENVGTCILYSSRSGENAGYNSLRPIITITSNILVKDKTAGGKTIDSAWELQ